MCAGLNTLRRSLGLWEVALSGIGLTLGAGVYVLVGPATARAGNAVWLAFLLAGVAVGLTAYAYARLAPLRPRDSAEFQYTSLAFGPRVGFVAGWLTLSASLLAAAAVSLGFGGYFNHLTGVPAIPAALVLIGGLAIVLSAGITRSVGLALLLTAVELGGLVLVIAAGFPSLGAVDYLEAPQGVSGVWNAAALLLFAYLGFDKLGNLAEEMRDPGRDLPRALFVSLAAATAVYVLVAFASIGVVTWAELGASPGPLALVMERTLGSSASTALSLMAVTATANTVLLLLVSGSRSLYGMAAAGVLPGMLSRVGASRVPNAASGVVLGAVAVLILLGDVGQVAAMTNAAVLFGFILVNASLLRLSTGHRRRALPGSRLADRVVPALALASCTWMLSNTGWAGLLLAAGLTATGWLIGKRGSSPGAMTTLSWG